MEYALKVATIIAEAIAEFGSTGVPSGHLYANLTGEITLEDYTAVIEALKRTGLIEEKGHVLRAVGKLAAMKGRK